MLTSSSKSVKSKLENKIYTEMRIIAKYSGSIQDKMSALQHLKNKYINAWNAAEQVYMYICNFSTLSKKGKLKDD